MRLLMCLLVACLCTSTVSAQTDAVAVARAKAKAELLLLRVRSAPSPCCCDVCTCNPCYCNEMKVALKQAKDERDCNTAWDGHLKEGKPMVLFVGVPVRDIPGAYTAHCKTNMGNGTPRIVVYQGKNTTGHILPPTATDAEIRSWMGLLNYYWIPDSNFYGGGVVCSG